jgi:mannose-6-phosphate isomerase
MSQELIQKSENWLRSGACPLWLKKGIDTQSGGFYESMSLQGEPLRGSRRVMVQARQIFSSHIAMQLGVISAEEGRRALRTGVDFMMRHYSAPDGSFYHAVDEKMKPLDKPADLYAQAFALFGLGQAFKVFGEAVHKRRALELLQYLRYARKAPHGGFTEFGEKGVMYEANPHMHLFEATLYWMEIDMDSQWREVSDEILQLCLEKFIDSEKGLLAEHFTSQWAPLQHEGRYIFEPGHHYEWAWLLGRYQKLAKKDLHSVRGTLYEISEKYGINKERGSAYDEVWSDLTPHKKTGRFWPQCERIKAALQLGLEASDKAPYAAAADEALRGLFHFLDVEVKGLWFDTWQENGQFTQQPAKASSLYHIIGAMADYIQLRKKLGA